MADAPDHWQLDKRVPLAQIISFFFIIVVQTGGLVWWAANISKEQEIAAEERQALSARIAVVESGQIDRGERLIRLETKMEALQDNSDEILAILRNGQGR